MVADDQVDILVLTATKVETRAVFQAFGVAGQDADPRSIDGRVYFDIGAVNGARMMLTQSEMGTSGPGASLQAVQKGIAAFSPSAVIMVGIAFGVDNKKQRIGDVLIAAQLCPYELQRVGTKGRKVHIVPRGDKAHASPWLLNLFRSAEQAWSGATLRFGTLLSGEKLVDNFDFREQLRGLDPETIGGEMEGAGLYVSCQDKKVDWILVKGICDFADGEKGKSKARRQALAAKNAAAFVLHAISYAKVNWSSHRGAHDAETTRIVSATSPEAESLRRDGLDKKTVLDATSAFRRAMWEYGDSRDWVKRLSARGGPPGQFGSESVRQSLHNSCSDRNTRALEQAVNCGPVMLRAAERLGIHVDSVKRASARDPLSSQALDGLALVADELERRLGVRGPSASQIVPHSPSNGRSRAVGFTRAAQPFSCMPSKDCTAEEVTDQEVTGEVTGEEASDKKSPAKSPAKKPATKKSPTKKSPTKRSPAKKPASKKPVTKKSPTKKSPTNRER